VPERSDMLDLSASYEDPAAASCAAHTAGDTPAPPAPTKSVGVEAPWPALTPVLPVPTPAFPRLTPLLGGETWFPPLPPESGAKGGHAAVAPPPPAPPPLDAGTDCAG
jgi:hypothetical protein